jgi:hypothetical protein
VITGWTPRRWGAFDRLLALAALAAGAVIALRAPGFGDYPSDGGPALSAIAHGSVGGFFSHQPAMGSVSLFVRAPFAMLGTALHESPFGIYRLGDLPCMLAVALVATWMARVAGRRGTGRAGQALIVALCLFNPLIDDALYFGHPEELLTASFAVGALLAACDRRVVLAAVLAGLAVATKQWALLIVCPTLLALERERIRAALIMFAVAAGSTAPMVLANFAAFRNQLHYISTPQPVTTLYTWIYPFFPPTRLVHISNIFGDQRIFLGHTVPAIVSSISHPLIIGLGVVVPLLVWERHGRRLSAPMFLYTMALLFLLRCALDPGSAGYYHFPLLLTLVALDATAGRRIPLAGLAGAAGAFTVLDRFPGYLDIGAANALYIVATVAAAALLARELRRGVPGGSARRREPSPGAAPGHQLA